MELTSNRPTKKETQSLPIVSQQVKACCARYPLLTCRSDVLLEKFPANYPHKIALFCSDIATAHSGTTPTIAALSQVHGPVISTAIIASWIASLDSYVGKGVLNSLQIEELSVLLLQSGYFVKLAEMAVFFQMLKSGKFGQLYGTLSPIWVMEQFQSFLTHRRQELEKYDREQERNRREAEREQWKHDRASPEEIAEIRAKYPDEVNGLLDTVINAK
ncbi:MAG: DUF6633 family protein [Bacteroides sp.]|uniref:DUF6633 family protein n=1 Tax=Bacteroides sp. TaxID=29523 RepID=UPI002FCAB392